MGRKSITDVCRHHHRTGCRKCIDLRKRNDKWQCFKRKLVEKSESHGRSIPPASVFLKPLSECDTLWCNFQEQSVLDTASVFSDNLKFYGLTINNPSDSPNTDGLDPESCKNVDIVGVKFSLGDDCIAVKSGKIYMGKKYRTPSENIHIRQCLMENGHGAVTVGSEMAGGVKNLVVEECRFYDTDRGLRIKTRRGRGKDAVLDQIIFRKIDMDQVMTPFVINCFYFCDPDGKTEFVQSREKCR